MADRHEIKLRADGYRLVYRVDDEIIHVTVISIGLRDKREACVRAHTRLHDAAPD